jgi:adenylate cyclase
MFAVQDEITQKIVGMLAVGLEEDALDRAKRKHPENLIAYDHWLRGKRILWTPGSENLESRHHFERAAAADPSFSRAYSGLAVTYQMEALDLSIAREGKSAYDKAFEYAQKALALDEADYQAHIALGWPCLYRGDYARMKKHVDRAIMLNPNDADSLANASYMLALYGEAETAVACGEAAMRLNPRHPDWYIALQSTALFTARRYADAFAARTRVPDYFIDSTFFGAAMLARMDKLVEARQWAERAVARLQATPGGAEQAAKGCIQLLLDNNPYRRQEDRDHFAEAMRRAGVPG